jgi:hypothetical protein
MSKEKPLKGRLFKIVYMSGDQPEKSIQGIQELEAVLRTMQEDEYPKSVNLLAPNGDILTIALGSEFGFVQHEDGASTSPTYSIAVDKSRIGAGAKYREVDAGGTPTPIPEYACLPPGHIVQIVLDYARSLKKPAGVDWQQL